MAYVKDFLEQSDLASQYSTFAEKIKKTTDLGLSKYKYRYEYNMFEDSADEIETSIIYAPKTSLPRSIRFRISSHSFGMSTHFIDATVRIEGLESILKDKIFEKLSSIEFIQQLAKAPEQIVQMIKMLTKNVFIK